MELDSIESNSTKGSKSSLSSSSSSSSDSTDPDISHIQGPHLLTLEGIYHAGTTDPPPLVSEPHLPRLPTIITIPTLQNNNIYEEGNIDNETIEL